MEDELKFNKYSSIENTYQTLYLNKVRQIVPKDAIWDVTEKVHGANCCIITNGNDTKFAKRSGIIKEGENFFNYETVLEEFRPKIINAFNYIKKKYETNETIINLVQFYGELFGGAYPHPDVPRNSQFNSVQKGLYYAPYQSFYGFDIAIVYKSPDKEGRFWLNPDEMADVFEKNDIFYSKSLFRGTLDECLEFNNAFQSNIPTWLGLPPIEDNICEGVVFKPMVPYFFNNGDRILLKNKNERFSEKKKEKVHKVIPDLPEDVKKAISTVSEYINDNRLNNVISHEGEFDMPKDFGRLIKLFTMDILNDFIKEYKEWNSLEKVNQKLVTKEVNSLAVKVIKDHYGIR